jgi:hypothetical protein
VSLLFLVGCATTTLPGAATQNPVPTGDLQLLAPELAEAGGPYALTAYGADPGDVVRLGMSTAGIGPGGCPPSLGGACLDLQGPVRLLGTAVADANGFASFTVRLPARLGPTPVFLQAAVPAGGNSKLSNPAEVRIQPASWGDQLDCGFVCGARPAGAGWCWTDATQQCADPTGCVSTCEAWCQANEATMSISERNALGACAASDPVCFQNIEMCVDSTARAGVWLQPEVLAVADASGDGQWTAGEALLLDVALDNLGIDFFAYPMVQIEADVPGITFTPDEMVWFGMGAGDRYDTALTAQATGVAAGTAVTFTVTATQLHCNGEVRPGCVDPNTATVTVLLQ